MAQCEYAWTSFNDNAKVFKYASFRTEDSGKFHPTEKPIALYKWILTNYANKGDKILDTHVGSAVLNLWTTSNSGNTYRSAQLTILNQLGQEAVYLTGNETVGGRLSLKMYGAQNEVYINSLSGLQIYNDLGNSSLWVGADGSGNGIFYLNHKSNEL